jgi:hypothetical protein
VYVSENVTLLVVVLDCENDTVIDAVLLDVAVTDAVNVDEVLADGDSEGDTLDVTVTVDVVLVDDVHVADAVNVDVAVIVDVPDTLAVLDVDAVIELELVLDVVACR